MFTFICEKNNVIAY